MGRFLAIDYGTKRCGIAVTDPLRIIAAGLTTVHPEELMAFLDNYLKEEQVDNIVIGLPLHEDGTKAQLYERVVQVGRQIDKRYPAIKLDYWDERYTSRMAKEIIRMSGAKRKKRQDKATVDKVSAGIILQEYLEQSEKEQRL
ncbi:MAG: Holliday junction resolvase RuvX [Saprospiraceae bacterium]|nr:Holliday junction resolvase RuvX [Saprospiraceae bacterium]